MRAVADRPQVSAEPRGPRAGRPFSGRTTFAAFAPVALASAVAVAPFVALVVDLVRQAATPVSLPGDLALIELATREAARGTRLLGAWSRFIWHHPGPIYFYALAPAYVLSGSHAVGLSIGAVGVNACAALAAVGTVRRRAGAAAGLVAALVVAGYALAVGPLALRDVWNPTVVVLPAFALLVLAAAAACGSGWALAGAVLAATFVTQTHVGTAPLAVLVVAAAVVGWSRGSRRLPAGAVGLLAVSVVAWIPPLVEQLTVRPGNLADLLTFLRTPDPGHPLGEALRAFVFGASPFAGGLPPHDLPASPGPGRVAAVVGYAVVTVICLVAGLRRGDRFVAWLAALAAAGGALAVLALTGVRGPILGYLVYWVAALPLAALTAAGAMVARTRAVGVGAAVAGLVAGVAFVGAVSAAPPLAVLSDPRIPAIVEAADRHGALDAGPVLVRVASRGHGEWIVLAGVVDALAGRGVDTRVSGGFLFRFSPRHRATGTEPTILVIGERDQPLDPAEAGDAQPLVTVGDTVVLLGHPLGSAS